MERSYNGWTASKNAKDFGGLDNRIVPGTNGVRLIPGLRAGAAADVLFHVAAQLHARVEKGELYSAGDEWGFSYRLNRNANNLSCHSSGTAFDWNATRHPNGKRGTFTKAQVAEIRKILGEVSNVVRWGGDFSGTPDEMHFELLASPATVALVAERLKRVGSPITTLPAPAPEDDMPTVREVWEHQIATTDGTFPAEVLLRRSYEHQNRVVPAIVAALLDAPIDREALGRGPTTLRAILTWSDNHVDTLVSSINDAATPDEVRDIVARAVAAKH